MEFTSLIIDEDENYLEPSENEPDTKYDQKSWNIGMRRVDKIVQQENNQGKKAWATGMYSRLPDVVVFSDESPSGTETLETVYEVTNYKSPSSYITSAKANRYKSTLKKFNCRKVFVCSYEENLSVVGGRKFFEDDGIEVEVRGYQD